MSAFSRVQKNEFLQMGFAEASLRVIASEAQTTTGSIYTRFGDKQGLFEAIVGTAAEGMRKMFLATQEEFDGYEAAVKEETVYSYSSGAIDTLVDYLYEHFEEFKLIVCCSAGQNTSTLSMNCGSMRWSTPTGIWIPSAVRASDPVWSRKTLSI